MRQSNQRKSGVVGEEELRELQLFIDNDGELYERSVVPIQQNLVRKMEKGNYDPDKAPKVFSHLVDRGAKKYAREFSSSERDWNTIFNKATRDALAERYARDFEMRYRAGDFDHMKKEARGRKRNADSDPHKTRWLDKREREQILSEFRSGHRQRIQHRGWRGGELVVHPDRPGIHWRVYELEADSKAPEGLRLVLVSWPGAYEILENVKTIDVKKANPGASTRDTRKLKNSLMR